MATRMLREQICRYFEGLELPFVFEDVELLPDDIEAGSAEWDRR